MFSKKVPKEFWDYGMWGVCDIQQRTHMRTHQMDGGVTLENITGETEYISDYLDFGFYDWVWFHENSGLGERGLGRWLGVSHCTVGAMSDWILKANGYVVSQTTVQIITNQESEISENQLMFLEFDEEIKRRIKNNDLPIDGDLPDPVK